MRERRSAGCKGEEARLRQRMDAHLHDQVWPECSHARDTDARFGCAVRGSCATEYHGRCNSALLPSTIVSWSSPLQTQMQGMEMDMEVMGRAGIPCR